MKKTNHLVTVIVIVILVALLFTVFVRETHEEYCNAPDGFICEEYSVRRNEINLVIKNNYGENLENFNLRLKDVDNRECPEIYYLESLSNGKSTKISISCADVLDKNYFNGTIELWYDAPSGSLSREGKILVRS